MSDVPGGPIPPPPPPPPGTPPGPGGIRPRTPGEILSEAFRIYALVTVLLYLDLRARTEALTADRLRTELTSSM
jgi:hypothetical protein